MIQFAIPKVFVENLDSEPSLIGGAEKGEPKRLFNTILATYLAESGEEANSLFGFEGKADLGMENEKGRQQHEFELVKMALGLYNLRLEAPQELPEETNGQIVQSDSNLGTDGAVFIGEGVQSLEVKVTSVLNSELTELVDVIQNPSIVTVKDALPEGAKELVIPSDFSNLPELEGENLLVEPSLAKTQEPSVSGWDFERELGETDKLGKELHTRLQPSLRQVNHEKLQQLLRKLDAADPTLSTVEEQVASVLQENPELTIPPEELELLVRDGSDDLSVQVSWSSEKTFSDFGASVDNQEKVVLSKLSTDDESVEKAVFLPEESGVEAMSPSTKIPEKVSLLKSRAEMPQGEPQLSKTKRVEAITEESNISPLADSVGTKLIQMGEEQNSPIPSKPVLDLRAQESVLPKITKQIESLIQEERTEVRIQLKPEHLGEMKIRLSLERGIMQAEFVVENEAVREVIASQLPNLQTALQEQGANVAQMMVNIDFGQSKNDEQQARPKTFTQVNTSQQTNPKAVAQRKKLSNNPWYQVDLRA